MTTTQQYLDYSSLSFAAYAEDLLTKDIKTQYVRAGFTQTQAEKFIASGWEVVSQSSDAKYGSSGFSATLFHNTQTGEYVFANRGTDEIVSDLLDADVWGIVVNGAAGTQIIDMYRYYKQLITPENQVVTYTAEEIEKLRAVGGAYHLPFNTTALVESYVQNDIGLGKISSTQTFSTTGHSLGGHLSLWLSNYLLPTVVTDTYTYNGAGIGSIFSSAVTTALGAITGNPTTFVPSNNVTNLYAYGDVAVIAGVGGSVGQNFPVNIEYKTLLSNPIDYVKFYNHSIVQLTDSIAVANLLNKLDSNITTSKFNDFFDKSSNKIGESLEGVLDSLRKFFGMANTTPNDNRPQFYDNLYALQNSATFQALIGKVTLVAPPTSASEARSDLGLFLSLYYLTPFALKTDGSISADAQLTIANPDLATQFKDDKLLTPDQIANGEANFSDLWLADRAAMLSWQNKLNALDVDATALNPYISFGNNPQYFRDITSDKEIFISSGAPAAELSRDFVFGSSANNTITGHTKNDHLYGMGGNDIVNGGDGNDYLEGGAGQDTLKGEAGNDILIGGTDVDILDGGEGNDQLKGGAGVDVYQFTGSNYGFDTISDSDGLGIITISPDTTTPGTATNVGSQLGDNRVYQSADKQHTYTYLTGNSVDGGDLLIDSSILIKDHKLNGAANLSINLTPSSTVTSAPTPPATTRDIIGDKAPIDFDLTTEGIQSESDDLGNIKTANAEPNREDYLYGSAANDHIMSLDGNDIINASQGGDDYIEAGAGKDRVTAGNGSNLILGGADTDILIGGTGKDMIYAGSTATSLEAAISNGNKQTGSGVRGDWLSGGAGDDVLLGDTGNDVLTGGAGKDTLIGGAGDDDILGDSNWVAQSFEWAITETDGERLYSPVVGIKYPAEAATDLIYAGKGNDHVYAGQGNDIVYGEDGNDILIGEEGDDILIGGEGDDKLYGDASYLPNANGNDVLYGGAGQDELQGGDGNDYLDGGSENDKLSGGEGNDTLMGGTGVDALYGGEGNDTLIGSGDGDQLSGGGGSDTFYLKGADRLASQDETDKIIYLDINNLNTATASGSTNSALGSAGVTITVGSAVINLMDGLVAKGDASFTFADGSQIKQSELLGTTLNNQITLSSTENTLFGGKLNDYLQATGSANSTLYGGLGDDTLIGNDGNNTLNAGAGNDAMAGGLGDDIYLVDSTSDAIEEQAASGIDTVMASSTYFLTPFVENLTLTGQASINGKGNQLNNVLLGNGGNNTLVAGAGDDVVLGGAGVDTLYGQTGNDSLIGGAGNDVLDGGAGTDTYQFNLGDGNDTLYEQSDAISHIQFGAGISMNDISITYTDPAKPDPSLGFTIHYGNSGDSIQFKQGLNNGITADFSFADGTTISSIEALLVEANKIAQTRTGDATNNILMGSTQNDALAGMLGDDAIISGKGNDRLEGGLGYDMLIGGSGDDTYVFNLGDGQDFIIDNRINAENNSFANNAILFAEGISIDSVTTSVSTGQDGINYLTLYYGNKDDSITIQNGSNNSISSFTFTDSNGNFTSYSLNSIIANPLTLIGTSNNETLTGGRNNDSLNGKAGDDTLIGGLGNDTYYFALGDGSDKIIETGSLNKAISTNDVIEFAAGINLNTVVGTQSFDGSGNEYLNLQYGSSPTDTISIVNGFYGAIQTIRYKAGYDANNVYHYAKSYSYAELIATTVNMNLTLNGKELDDILTGGKANDVIKGGLGNDNLSGSGGNDWLDGGAGNDKLTGGDGLDTYILDRNTGRDVVIETNSQVSLIKLGARINLSDIGIAKKGGNLELFLKEVSGEYSNKLVINDYFSNSLSTWQITTENGSASTSLAFLLDQYEQDLAALSLEDKIEAYKNNFVAAVEAKESLIAQQINYGYDTHTLNFNTVVTDSDDVNIYGTAINNSDKTQTGSRAYTAYNTNYIEEKTTIDYRFFSLTDLALLYGDGGATVTIPTPYGLDVIPTSQPSLGFLVPFATTFASSYTLESYTTTVPTYTIAQQLYIEYLNGGESNNNIQEVNGSYADNFNGVRIDRKGQFEAYLDISHQIMDGGAGNDILSGGGWSLDANATDAFYAGLRFYSNMKTSLGSLFYGGSGTDTLIGTALADELIGGTGDDFLNGAAGGDIYHILSGNNQGWDTINDSGYARVKNANPSNHASSLFWQDAAYGGVIPNDTVVFEAGIKIEDLVVSWGANDVNGNAVIDISWGGASGIHVVIPNVSLLNDNKYSFYGPFYAGGMGIELFQFYDGTSLTLLEMQELINLNNNVPVLGLSLADFVSTETQTFNYIIPINTFTDADAGDVLSYTVTLANGDALPIWLTFNALTRIISGTPQDANVGALDLRVTATDIVGSSVQDTFTLTINPIDRTIVGTAANDNLIGGQGNDTIDGGAGIDTMRGGKGNDNYIVDIATDVVVENLNEGIDTIQTSVTLTSLAANVENLTLTGTTAINGTGNTLNNVLTGNSTNNSLNGGVGADTMQGGLGNDTYTVDDIGDVVVENANEGADRVNSSISYTLGANVENLTLTGTAAINGTGNDLSNSITGNSASNILAGGISNDVLNGGAGADSLIGNAGNDTYVIDNLGDVVLENVSDGTDLVQTSITLTTLASNVENITLTGTAAISGTGNELNNLLTGNVANNTLNGGEGNDTLNGAAGIDTLIGGLGNDIYVVDSTTDSITENANEGTDTVQSSVTQTSLATNVENLTVTGTAAINATGNDLDNLLTGNAAMNNLTGGAGDDTLNGAAGADTMAGGIGDDTYIVDNLADVLVENIGEGIDTIQTAITLTSLAANVENLIISGTAARNATGNALNNTLTGNTGNNILDGGLGADILIGGLGNDTYVIDDAGDVISETSSLATEIDIVQSSINYTLGSNLERLTLTGATNINATGSELNNTLTGNAGNNVLDGGLGNDSMIGGLGDDTYLVDSATDIVTEAASAGIDNVQSSLATYTLGGNVENLTLVGTANLNGTGNTLANTIIGNAGDNMLSGGTGADSLIGNQGNDTYIVDNTGDTVTENDNEGVDTIKSSVTFSLSNFLENLNLTGIGAINGTGNALSNFLSGTTSNNILNGLAGTDVLQGLAGNDTLTDSVDSNLYDGGSGTDILTAGSGNDLLIGALGNDTITTGTGYDVISFNKGDGADTINASTGADNTLSLGGNFAYSDLSLTKMGNNLILKMGATDQITLRDWYLSSPTNKSVINLQVVAEAIQGFNLGGTDVLRDNKVETFNFANLVAAFDAAGATANWQLTDAHLTVHLKAGSDVAAIGGDLAYQYGKNSNMTGMGLINAQSVISNANFGQTAQALNNPTVWQAELVKLS